MKGAVGNGLADKNEIANYASREQLRDGRPVLIRAIRPDDRGRLIEALTKVSPQSLYLRLFSGKRKFSDEEMEQFTKVDFEKIVALVAVLCRAGVDEIVGGGRYVRLDPTESGQSAEVAFLIDDAHQGLGIGSRLFQHLVRIARRAGIIRLEAEVLPSNGRMLGLFSRCGLPVATTRTRDSVHVTIRLSTAEGESANGGGVGSPG
jgi:RimJ/RimL family protein N-acetyltransferase